MIVSSTPVSTVPAETGLAPIASAEGSATDQGFFGLLVAQAGTETAPTAAPLTAAPELAASTEIPLPTPAAAKLPVAAEPAAPVATTLLVGASWQATPAPVLSTTQATSPIDNAAQPAPSPAASAAPMQPVQASMVAVDMASAMQQPIVTSAPSTSEAAAEPAEDDETQDGEELTTDMQTAEMAAALLAPIQPVLVPVVTAPAQGDARTFVAAADVATVAAAAPRMAAVEAVPAETTDGQDATVASGEDLAFQTQTQTQTGAEPAAAKASAEQGSGRISLDQLSEALVARPQTAELDAKVGNAEAAPDRPTGAANSGSTRELPAQPTAEQAALAAGAARPVAAADNDRGGSMQPVLSAPTELAPAAEDAAQGDAGGSDQFQGPASAETLAGPHVAVQAHDADADFKAMVAGADRASEPHRAVQIATVHLEKAAASRSTDALTIQLEPLDLGKIEVQLDFGDKGRVHASITAENPQTLDLLQRDSRSLERALQSAGLQADAGSMSFNLREDSRGGREFGQQQRNGRGNGYAFNAGDAGINEIQIVAARASLGAAGRVDIRI